VRVTELLFDSFGFPTLCLVHAECLIAVVVALVFFEQKFHLITKEWEAHHDAFCFVVDCDALLDNVLLEGFLQTFGFFPGGLCANGAVAARVTAEVSDIFDIPLVHQTYEF
jgi:hypothetical protein